LQPFGLRSVYISVYRDLLTHAIKVELKRAEGLSIKLSAGKDYQPFNSSYALEVYQSSHAY
jgi:hypothetical protein